MGWFTPLGDKANDRFAEETGAYPLPASAAHEINNPLDSLLTLLYLLEAEASLTPKGLHYLSLARDEVRRISEIARNTLKHRKLATTPERTNIRQLVANVIDFYQQRLDLSGVVVQTRYSGDANVPVYAGQLRQLFSNLLLNAIEAMPQGGNLQVRVTAGREWSDQNRCGVRITVADNGSGIPKTILPQIFQPFFTMKPNGHGMGLSLVKEVVQKHQGQLRVRSSTQARRHGTAFSLFLPAA